MTDVAIRVENLGKLYRIGRAQQRHDTLRDALVAGPSTLLRAGLCAPLECLSSFVRRSFDGVYPERTCPERSRRSRGAQDRPSNPQCAICNPQSDIIWALKDVSFEVQRGEVVGIKDTSERKKCYDFCKRENCRETEPFA